MYPPEPLPGIIPWYVAFWELSTDRKFFGAPIPWSSIEAWPTFDKDTFRECIRAADREYLTFLSKKPEDRVSPKVFGPGVFSRGFK